MPANSSLPGTSAFKVVPTLNDPAIDVRKVSMALTIFRYKRRGPNHMAGHAMHEGNSAVDFPMNP